ncbi:dihydrodipicolinate synthase family protein [Methylobacterium currus]|uniref:Dihydrodipicolinate synthase family protein n=1 Tax=Methylobacterium currus TaxID=2051553 RepID=A0A2R4WPG8_9HYPH|nr:dihydrodipicolinate synthase family protein [Methylobacterium currus]AWB23423.1 dihydrodipicolinate synthase family protein [Methylobacterium currus]UHC16931.1 dihydrodipicolinate synthase family protein [Methylobacterium currus]
MTNAITGLWVALATPLDATGAVDHGALVRHVRFLMERGCDGVVPFGTTGEGTSFSAPERLAAVEALLAAGIPAERIGLGAGTPAIPDAVALSKAALGLGLTHVLVLPPYFYRDVTEAGIVDAFAAFLDGVGDDRLRATLYHIPQTSGVGLPPGAVATLRARYGRLVAGVKDSSGDFAQFQAFRAAAPEVAVCVGNEADIGRALAEGGTGTICGMANLVPDLVRAMFTDPAAAEPMRAAIGLIRGPFVPVLKSAMAAMTGEPAFGRVRPPLVAADPATGQRIAADLAGLSRAAAA